MAVRRKLRNQIWLVLVTYSFAVIWVQLILRFLRWLTPQAVIGNATLDVGGMQSLSLIMRYLPKYQWGHDLLALSPKVEVFMSLVFAPLVEEAVFRMGPLLILLVIMRKWGHEDSSLRKSFRDMVLVVVCGIGFGIAHGHPFNVFIQGAVGVFLGILYLKNAPQQRYAAYFTCVCVHSLYNLTAMVW